MKNTCIKTASCEYVYPVHGGKTAVIFKNHITGARTIKTYKTKSAAKSAATKFLNKVNNNF